MRLKQRSQHAGFTLVELLVVIAIIAILAAILFPVFAQAREKIRGTSCLSNLRQIGVSMTMYLNDKGEGFPAYIWGQNNITTGATRTTPMAGPGVRVADWNPSPTTPAERYVLGDGQTPFHYFSWMDSLYKYTRSVQVFTCPSHTFYPIDVSKTTPPFDGDPERYSGVTGNWQYWLPSYGFNAHMQGWYMNGRVPVKLSQVNGAASKVLLVHNIWSYGYMNPLEFQQIADGRKPEGGPYDPATSAWTRGAFPHNDGSAFVFADGHTKYIPRVKVKQWTCDGNIYFYNLAASCGYWTPQKEPPTN